MSNQPILIAGGDSFIYGLDLLDCNPSNNFSHSLSTWTALLSKSMNRRYVCAAYPGNSNPAIARKTILACEQNRAQDIFVVVSWSFLNRIEFKFTIDPMSKPYDAKTDPEGYALGPYGPWRSVNSKDLYPEPDESKQKIFTHLDKDILKFLRDYYRYVGSDDVYEYYCTVKEIVFLQNYLKLNNIPYMFTSAHSYFRKTFDDPSVNCLVNMIDQDPWFFYPPLKGFVEWARDNGYACRDEHFTEEAHADAFELVRDYLNEKN